MFKRAAEFATGWDNSFSVVQGQTPDMELYIPTGPPRGGQEGQMPRGPAVFRRFLGARTNLFNQLSYI